MAEKNFVEVTKNGMHLVVHPTTVKAHTQRGWVVVETGVELPKPEKPKETKEESKEDSKAESKGKETAGKEAEAKK